jgi:hypothetical protein
MTMTASGAGTFERHVPVRRVAQYRRSCRLNQHRTRMPGVRVAGRRFFAHPQERLPTKMGSGRSLGLTVLFDFRYFRQTVVLTRRHVRLIHCRQDTGESRIACAGPADFPELGKTLLEERNTEGRIAASGD